VPCSQPGEYVVGIANRIYFARVYPWLFTVVCVNASIYRKIDFYLELLIWPLLKAVRSTGAAKLVGNSISSISESSAVSSFCSSVMWDLLVMEIGG
jgi:hypothetical protein